MTGRERFLIALKNGKPDRLPCQVHNWMTYYLNTYLKGMDAYQAYDYVGMDPVIYAVPNLIFDDKDLKNWAYEFRSLGTDADGVESFIQTYHTPKGDLEVKGARNQFTTWETEPMIKTEKDFELFREYYPVPVKADWSPVTEAKNKVGDRGIVRSVLLNYGQPGIWQSFTCLVGTEKAIMLTYDEPDWVHYVLRTLSDKSLRAIENMGKIEADLIENGGGAASSTVISPAIHREFCLPYDKLQNDAIHRQGALVVYHMCGGLMLLLEEAAQRIGDRVSFIGGFDQNEGFERGNKEFIRREVRRLFEAKPNGGYICSPSDHFFFGDPENLKLFAQVCRECEY